MTKKELIQKAYGEYWKESKSFIDENGWMNSKEWLGSIGNTQIFTKLKGLKLYCMNNYDPTYCYWFRPKSLQGIEKNNGWIKIESKDDLPKNNNLIWVMIEGLECCVNVQPDISNDDYYGCDGVIYHSRHITHYQQINKPNEPMY